MAPALAQTGVAARQGEAPEPDIIRFNSPMVLEIPMSDLRNLEPGTKRKLPSVRKYICDNDVSIITLYIEKVYAGPKKQRTLSLVVTGSISVVDSYDRLVDVALRLTREGRVFASNSVRGISAEEERVTAFKAVIPITEAALNEAFAESKATLELTLAVHDNS